MIRRTVAALMVATALFAARPAGERKSWNKIRYAGGTIAITTSAYDWNTTLTIATSPASIVLSIAPGTLFSSKQTVRIAPSLVTSISVGAAARRRVGEVGGAHLDGNLPPLFGLMQDNGYLGIVFQTDEGKPASVLLETHQVGQILAVLKSVTGKAVDDSP
jgi:hypothetical protein